ncbi:8520_t:CDS:2, partial [Rhizophagus irregularis]
MGFTQLDKDSGLKTLNNFLQDKSYIESYEPSQADVAVFEALNRPDSTKYPHAARWYNHIASYSESFSSLPGTKKDASSYGPDEAKPKVIAKSMVILDVKPWDDTTDLAEMEKFVRSIELDGLVWGASKLVPVGYGINKLQISCVVEDDKVGVDDLEERITGFEEHVQSVDVAAFNK